MLSNIGPGMLLVIVIVALLLFGPSKLPELGRAFGKTLREFKNGAREAINGEDEKGTDPSKTRKEVSPEVEVQQGKQEEKRNLPD